MRLGLLVVIVGLAAGIVVARLGASSRRAWRAVPDVRWWPLAVVGVGLAVVAGRVDPQAFAPTMVVATAALVAFGVVNHAHPGARLLTAGVVANGIVVIANAGMPVAADAVVAAGGDPGALAATGRHHLLTESSALPWLADTVGISMLRAVVSPGDLLLVVGGVVAIAALLVHAIQREQALATTATSTQPRVGQDAMDTDVEWPAGQPPGAPPAAPAAPPATVTGRVAVPVEHDPTR